MGLNDQADPDGDSAAAQVARQEAAGEQEPGTGQGDVAAAAGRPPQAGGESQDEPLVSGDDDEDLPAARAASADPTADPVKD
jgi:hypothetical protein